MLTKGKLSYDHDISHQLSREDTTLVRQRSQQVKRFTRLRTLNEFILESLRASGTDPSSHNTEGGGNNGMATPSHDSAGMSAEEEAWASSRANHRGTVLEAVSSENCSFIVNVSSMEGKFYRPKTEAHPHTNMAKGESWTWCMSIRLDWNGCA